MILSAGSFEVSSGEMLATDPCYTKGTWCTQLLTNVTNGKWDAYYDSDSTWWGQRVCSLLALHSSVTDHSYPKNLSSKGWEFVGYCGVDSGQCGLFDAAKYPDGSVGDYDDKESFYGRVCNLTYTESYRDTPIEFGVASSSGFGDGSYKLYVLRDKTTDRIVGAHLIYIWNNEKR